MILFRRNPMILTQPNLAFIAPLAPLKYYSFITSLDNKLNLMDDRPHILRHQINLLLPLQREARLQSLFVITKKGILAGKKYKDTCLNEINNPRRYEQFKKVGNKATLLSKIYTWLRKI